MYRVVVVAVAALAGIPADAFANPNIGQPSAKSSVVSAEVRLAARSKRAARRVLLVGPDRKLKVPSHAARFARTGDEIRIDAGIYRDCAVWRADNLILRGVGGYAHVTDVSCEQKGIWVIKGNNTQVINIEFSNADVPHNNGAGIRQEGRNLVVRNSYFHDNENGILTGHDTKSRISIVSSIFERNGKCQPHCAHGIYAGRIGKLTVSGSTFKFQKVGHHIKSRALTTHIVGNRIEDGPTGTASLSINLPNGGTAVVRGNYIQQGPGSHNHSVMVSIGEEGVRNPSRGLIFQQNVFHNDNPKPTVFIRNRTRQPVALQANRFFGNGRKIQGGPNAARR